MQTIQNLSAAGLPDAELTVPVRVPGWARRRKSLPPMLFQDGGGIGARGVVRVVRYRARVNGDIDRIGDAMVMPVALVKALARILGKRCVQPTFPYI